MATAFAFPKHELQRADAVKRVDFTDSSSEPLDDMFSMRLSKSQAAIVDAEAKRISTAPRFGRPGVIRRALQMYFDLKEIDPFAEKLGMTKESILLVAFYYWLEHAFRAKPLRDEPPGSEVPAKPEKLPETILVKKPKKKGGA